MELIEQCYHALFWGVLCVLALGIVAALIYIIRSHLTVDRIIGINFICTVVTIIISLLALLLGEDYLADVAIIYVVMSFIAVMMLCRMYINLYDKRKKKEREGDTK